MFASIAFRDSPRRAETQSKYIPPFSQVEQVCAPPPPSFPLGRFAVAGSSRVIDPYRVRKKPPPDDDLNPVGRGTA
jgi:hypothetical protein